MNENGFVRLSVGVRLQLLRCLLTGTSPLLPTENMSAPQLAEAYQFIREKALEIGIRLQGERFSQAELMRRLLSAEQYKADVGCREPLQRCETNACMDEHPECASRKLREQIDRLFQWIAGYLGNKERPLDR